MRLRRCCSVIGENLLLQTFLNLFAKIVLLPIRNTNNTPSYFFVRLTGDLTLYHVNKSPLVFELILNTFEMAKQSKNYQPSGKRKEKI